MTEAPFVYVLLLNWNGWRLTLECLESLLRQDHPRYRILVCDNGSSDGSVERLRAWAEGSFVPEAPEGPLRRHVDPPVPKPVRLAEHDRAAAEAGGDPEDADTRIVVLRVGENLGFAGGNNVGLRYVMARGDAAYVWVLNNDTVVAPDALSALVARAAAEPGTGMVGSKLVYYDDPTVLQAAAGGSVVRWKGTVRLRGQGEHDRGQWDGSGAPEYVHGASLLLRTALLRDVGLMDERYFIYFEEVDWAVRARRAGWRLAYAPASVVWHKESRTMGMRSPFQDYHSLRSTLLFARKFHPHLLPLVVGYSLYRHLLPKVVRRQPARIGAVLRAYRDLLLPGLGGP